MPNAAPSLGWLGIARLGLVQTSLGAIVVIMTSTINRVMVVELALPALVPGALVGLHYAVQVLRPRWGFGSDLGGRRTPWIIGGMAMLGAGATGAAVATALASLMPVLGIALAVLCFLAIGIGVGAAGTSLLALLATRVQAERRGAAAAIVWIMMIAGFALCAPLAGHFLDPFTPLRLVEVTATVSVLAVTLATLAVWGIEPRAQGAPSAATTGTTPAIGAHAGSRPSFLAAVREVLADDRARRFAIFVFVSMLAYSAQELVLEPFSGVVFGFTPGSSTKLSGVQHGGVLAGMIFVSLVTTLGSGRGIGTLRVWTVLGCLGSALPLLALASAASVGPDFPLRPAVFALGFFNGAFAVAAIGSMMGLAGAGQRSREGTRLGVWGAAQAVAFGFGGFAGTVAVDIARRIFETPAAAYGVVFAAEAGLFLVSAALAASLPRPVSESQGAGPARQAMPLRAVSTRSA
jgi:BCD family chlorophyll transporter-like MFS transporter